MVLVTVVRINAGADTAAAVYVRAEHCLDEARELAKLVTKGTALHLTAEDGRSWRWMAKAAA